MRTRIPRIILWFCLVIWADGCQSTPSANATVVNLRAESADTVVRLSWQPLPGASGYFVFRDNASTPLNSTPVGEAYFEDIGLTNGRMYTYTVAAVNQDGQMGPQSAPIQAMPKSG